jgi:putative endonuclease
MDGRLKAGHDGDGVGVFGPIDLLGTDIRRSGPIFPAEYSFSPSSPGLTRRPIPFPLARMRVFYVYILASKKGGTLYIGVTNDIDRRIFEHRGGRGSIFARRYGVFRLVYYETYPTAMEAISREKSLKKWPRRWKIDLIERDNPEWFDLYRGLNR